MYSSKCPNCNYFVIYTNCIAQFMFPFVITVWWTKYEPGPVTAAHSFTSIRKPPKYCQTLTFWREVKWSTRFQRVTFIFKCTTSWNTGLATALWAWKSWDRISVEVRFSAPFQTGPEAYPASYTMCTGSLPGRGVDHPPPSSTEVKERVKLYFYSPSGLRGLL